VGDAQADGNAVTPALETLEQRVRTRAGALGFDPVGIARLGPVESYPQFVRWLERGYGGDMSYMARGAEKRRDTTLPVPGARTAIVVALDYGGRQPAGSIARYARGNDYHDVMLQRLRELHRGVEADCGRAVAGKPYVDTGPVLERDLARRAGIGWIGKNTMLINPKRGSFFFLGALFLDLELEPDTPFETDRCGSCTRCLDACPTGAFVEPRVMDATRCISYLTIEHRGDIDEKLQPLMGDLIYGCDICQDVCPWNHKFASEPSDPDLDPRPENVSPDPEELIRLTDEGFRERFRGSPVKRAKRAGLARNALIAARNKTSQR
jgi:epoxyqueuosine reductase